MFSAADLTSVDLLLYTDVQHYLF